MKDVIVWLIHTPAGVIALFAAVVILLTPKGRELHRKVGICFTFSMLIMLISAFVAAALKESAGDMMLSAVILYTVLTAWLAARSKKHDTRNFDLLALAWITAVGIAAVFLHVTWVEGQTPNIYPFWVFLAVVCAIGDIRNLRQTAVPGVQRLVRHVWRMSFSLLWAILALTDKIIKMRGSDVKQLPEGEALYIVAVPSSIVLIIMFYWITDILFCSRKKFAYLGTKPK